jgi:HPt (histidine-containing phosphotransfer) domain-containing protein
VGKAERGEREGAGGEAGIARPRQGGGLRRKLLVGCMTPLVVAAVCQAIYAVSAERAAMLGGLEEKARSLCELMVDVVGPSLALDDPHGVEEGLGYVQRDSDFAFSAVIAADGRVAGYQGPEPRRAEWLAQLSVVATPRVVVTREVLVALHPLRPGSTELGTVVIGLRTASARAAVARMVMRVVAIATAGILMALAVVLVLASAILRRNRDLKLIMDNVGQGFLSVKRSGELLPEHSAILETWFGPWQPGRPIWGYLAETAPQLADWFELFWDNVTGEILPVEAALGQLPNRTQVGRSTFELLYRPIYRGTQLTHVLIVISDVSLAVERERATVEQRELVSLFQWLLKDRQGLLEFFSDGTRLKQEICAPSTVNRVTLKRQVHTLKGNCGVFNLSSVVAVCQQLENRIEEDADGPDLEDRARLDKTWQDAEGRLQLLIGEADESRHIEIDASEHQALLTAIGQGAPHPALFELVCSWSGEPMRRRLERLGQQASTLGRQLHKGEIGVRTDGGGVRLPKGALAAFWSNVSHVVRNAIDHGLETPEERAAAGKTEVGTISLRCVVRAGRLVMEIEDDGRGISWDKLAARARSLGLPAETRPELVEALFSDGVSTRDKVTETSGRGVGMSAVRAACLETGGAVQVWSEPGWGTRFEFSWPAEVLNPGVVSPPAKPGGTAGARAAAHAGGSRHETH